MNDFKTSSFVFLSTPSARRATPRRGKRGGVYRISIHALREEGDHCRQRDKHGRAYFYPRPPRGGRRHDTDIASIKTLFLSTPSARRATSIAGKRAGLKGISIHALREEGDPALPLMSPRWYYFYPRPPRGGRLSRLRPCLRWYSFLSTPSARRATPALATTSPPC